MGKRLTTEEFIIKAIARHGDKYDYSLTSYVGAKTKIIIICPDHGRFEQTRASHLCGNGCPDCGYIERHNSLRFSIEEFVTKARERHGDLYDYSKVEYLKSTSKVIIICKKHGEFEQCAGSHLQGCGCHSCADTKNGKDRTGTTERFIKKAKIKHGNRFDYSLAEYVDKTTKVIIGCRKHGGFNQTPTKHLRGQGCFKCACDAKSGSNSYLWNEKLTNEHREKDRSLFPKDRKEWINSIYARDNYTCQKCQTKGGKLNAHHILPYSLFPEVRFDVENGVTFCKRCHQQYHSMFKLAYCNHKTINQFLKLID